MTEAEREKIGSYEEAFEKIKEETGVNSMIVNIYKRFYSRLLNVFATEKNLWGLLKIYLKIKGTLKLVVTLNND